MEEWISAYSHLRYDLGNSGIPSISIGELLNIAEFKFEELKSLSLDYNDTCGSVQLREQISNLYLNASPENIVVTNGASEAIFIICNLLLNPGDEIVVLSPEFQLLSEVPRSLGGSVTKLPLIKPTFKRFNTFGSMIFLNRQFFLILLDI